MRLVDLEPRWTAAKTTFRYAEDRRGMGVSFLCPHCRSTRLAVFFKNPIDGHEPAEGELLWDRAGDTFDTLSLSPSIDAGAIQFKQHWHGHITNGEIR